MEPHAYWIGFNKVRGIGPARLRALLDCFGSVESAWRAPVAELQRAGLDRRSLANLLEARKNVDLAAELDHVREAGVTLLTWDDQEYPERLKTIYDPPPTLYVLGELSPRDEWSVALVGTRRASVYGKEVARVLATELARAGVTVISGLARGIDEQAHRAALAAGGRTIAVLGSGLDVIYPYDNRRLAEEIAGSGAVVSEYALGTQPEASNFPPRNRIISALSRGVVVVEAGEQSGALITADFAAEQGRDVFAVPGNIFQRGSVGSNRLIRDGAQPILDASDLLEALNLRAAPEQHQTQQLFPTDPVEAEMLDHLSEVPTHVDEVSRATGLPIATVTSTLAVMELKGLVRHVAGMSYLRAREAPAKYRID